MNWDDLRYILAVGQAGSLSGAAARLGLNHSTVFRRLGRIEQNLGVRLFQRSRDGYGLTPAGEDAYRLALQMDDPIAGLERRLMGRDIQLSGSLRVTTTDTLVELLAPILAAFRQRYPGITLELVVSNVFFSLTRREADVAIRPTTDPPEMLVGRRLCGIATALYASPGYLAEKPAHLPPAQHRWLAPDDSLAHLPAARWLHATVPDDGLVFRANTLLALREAARAGLGVAALPCFMAAGDDGLLALGGALPALASELWLLIHRDLRRVARVRVFMDAVAAGVRARQGLLDPGA